MATGSGLLALTMAAATVGAGPGDEPISCQVRVLTMDGLGWRSTYYPRLQPVARRGTSAVWTADRALAETLTVQALGSTVTPRCSNPGRTTVDLKTQTYYVGHMDRLADGPMNQATAIAFRPETAQVVEGFRVDVSGRKLDQGVLASVAIEESHITALHSVRMAESVVSGEPRPVDANSPPREIVGRFLKAVAEKAVGKAEPGVNFAVQVPEIAYAHVEGEWLIPRDGVLLVSLGVETVADPNGKAAVRERVAVLEVEAGPGGPDLTNAGSEGDRPRFDPPAQLAMPRPPSRSMPVAVDPAGRVVDLPPLPEAVASAELDRIKPDQPSPQSMHVDPPDDDRLARVGTEPRPEAALSPSEIYARLPKLPMPARSMPVAVDPAGRVVDLPPLPEAVASAELDRIKPEPGQPSGQSRHVVPESIRDGQLARTSFAPSVPAARCAIGPEGCSTPAYPTFIARVMDMLEEMDLDANACEMFRRYQAAMGEVGEAGRAEVFGELPPGKYLHDDVQYFEPAADFPYANTQAATQRARVQATAGTAPPPPALGLSVKTTDGGNEKVTEADLGAALKNPGQTETVRLPLGGKLSLEIRATVVPMPAETVQGPSPK